MADRLPAWTRAIMQSIPYAGGAIEILFGEYAERLHADRLRRLLSQLEEEWHKWELSDKVAPSEELHDLMRLVVRGAVETRHKEKSKFFARILARAVGLSEWNKGEENARLLRDLDLLHIGILFALSKGARIAGDAFGRLPVLFLPCDLKQKSEHGTPEIGDFLPGHYPLSSVRIAVAELISRGLAVDAGIGVFGGVPSMSYISLTDAGRAFLSWLDDSAAVDRGLS